MKIVVRALATILLCDALLFLFKRKQHIGMKGKYSETDYVMMKMQMLGNDRFTFGLSKHYDTEEEMYKDLIAELQQKLERVRENPSEPSKYGYRVELETFVKGEPIEKF